MMIFKTSITVNQTTKKRLLWVFQSFYIINLEDRRYHAENDTVIVTLQFILQIISKDMCCAHILWHKLWERSHWAQTSNRPPSPSNQTPELTQIQNRLCKWGCHVSFGLFLASVVISCPFLVISCLSDWGPSQTEGPFNNPSMFVQ